MSTTLMCLLVPLTLLLTACADIEATDGSNADDIAVGDEDEGEEAVGWEVFDEFGPETPGCAYAAQSPDGVVVSARGLADVEAEIPIGARTIFDIGSVSKQMTAGAIALLITDGELTYEDSIENWLDVGPYDPAITVGDLVHHTSGLPDYIELLEGDLDEVTTMADALDVINSAEGQPTMDPGAEFEYSNTNYVLLAELVEAVSDQSLVDFADDRIFTPLGMTKTRFRDDQGTLDGSQAVGYEEDDGDYVVTGSAWQQFGDGAVHTTVEDMLRWANLYIAEVDGVDGLGSDEWLELMLTPGPVTDDGAGYGGGIEILDDGEVLSHGGSWIGYSSHLTVLPGEGIAVAVACNIDGLDADEYADALIELVR